MLELCRRIYLTEYGTLKGFGKSASHYRDDWRHKDYKITGGYKKAWNSPIMTALREMYGM